MVLDYYEKIKKFIDVKPLWNNGNVILDMLLENISKINTSEPIAIYGSGKHTEILLQKITFKNPIYIVDNAQVNNKKINNHYIYNLDILRQKNIKNIIISSCADQYNIEYFLTNKLNYRYNIIKMYPIECVKSNTAFYNEAFYGQEDIGRRSKSKYYYYFIKKLDDNQAGLKEKEAIIKKLISSYLYDFNFKQAKHFIDRYISEFNKKGEVYKKIKDYILLVEKNVKEKICNISYQNNNPNICLIIMDAARKDLMSCYGYKKVTTPFLDSIMKECVKFNLAFSVSTYTKPCIASILSGKLPYDIEAYGKYQRIKSSDNNLCRELKERKYTVLSGLNFEKNFFEQGGKDKYIDFEGKGDPFTCENIWRMSDYVNRGPFFMITHFLDTHNPFIVDKEFSISPHSLPQSFCNGPYLYQKNKNLLNEIRQCYIDAQKNVDYKIQQLFKIMPENTIFIIMSDHGQNLGEKGSYYMLLNWYEETIRVPLLIYKKGQNGYETNGLFSISMMKDLILNIVDKGKIEFKPKPYIIVNREKIYNDFLNKMYNKETQGFRLLRTLNEKLVEYDNGKIEYYKLPDEKNIIKDELRINELYNILKNTPKIPK